jgi:hypothetical protein
MWFMRPDYESNLKTMDQSRGSGRFLSGDTKSRRGRPYNRWND